LTGKRLACRYMISQCIYIYSRIPVGVARI
jgi:hypothetical protein